MSKIEFILRQHTPLIHFQWHEKDATLRPTELKTKLDKWIIASITECHGNEKSRMKSIELKENDQLKFSSLYKWLKGAKKADKTHPALNYSVKVSAVGGNTFTDELNTMIETYSRDGETKKKVAGNEYAPYFGNQLKVEEFESGKKRIKRLSYFNGVVVTIASPYPDLIDKIKEEFPLFILKTNFATRQSKGFGSFFIEIGTEGFPEDHQSWFKNKFDWKFDVEVKGADERAKIKDLFIKIDLFYKMLRSGINTADYGGVYYKSLMFQYVKDKKKRQWDKKTIKQKYFMDNHPKTPNNKRSQPQNEAFQKSKTKYLNSSGNPKDPDSPLFWQGDTYEEKFLWRDLLGLSSVQQWMNYKRPGNNQHLNIYKKHFPNQNLQEITRFKSPIFFKPIRTGQGTFRVFFEVPDNIKTAFKDQANRVLAEESALLGESINIDTLDVNIPTWGLNFPDTFDFDEFIQFAASQHPAKQVYDSNHQTKDVYMDLLKMKITKA